MASAILWLWCVTPTVLKLLASQVEALPSGGYAFTPTNHFLQNMSAGAEHTFTVYASRPGDQRAAATASVVLVPRSEANVVTGSVKRVCGGGSCAAKHNAEAPLALSLALDNGVSFSAIKGVQWKADLPLDLSKVPLTTGQDLLVDPKLLPMRGILSIAAEITSVTNVKSQANITIMLNERPRCTKTSCFSIQLDNPAKTLFPDASYKATALGFVDDGPIS